MTTLRGEAIVAEFIGILNSYVARTYLANVPETSAVC
jgi:hypothetical protein